MFELTGDLKPAAWSPQRKSSAGVPSRMSETESSLDPRLYSGEVDLLPAVWDVSEKYHIFSHQIHHLLVSQE